MRAVTIFIFATIMCVGCKPAVETQMEKLSQTVRQSVTPGELEVWATKVISNTPRERLFVPLSEDGAPEGVRKLIKDNASLEVGMDGLSNDVVVILTGGSGFGHWGFAVGKPNYSCSLGRVRSHWTNGIWFWHE